MAFPSRAPVSPGDFYVCGSSNYAFSSQSVSVPATGTIVNMYSNMTNTAARTSGHMKGFSFNVEPGAYEAYRVTGGEVCVYAGAASLTGAFAGLFVESQGFSGAIDSDWNGLYVYTAPGANPGGNSAVVRLESNPSTNTWVDAFINMVGDPSYTFKISCTGTANNELGDKASGSSGWMKVDAGGYVRYIALYTG